MRAAIAVCLAIVPTSCLLAQIELQPVRLIVMENPSAVYEQCLSAKGAEYCSRIAGSDAIQAEKSEIKPLTKQEKKAIKARAKQARREAIEAANHITIPLTGWTSPTDSGCGISLSEMAFHRDVIRGWGGLLGGGNNAFLGVTSSLRGIVTNDCLVESLVTITAGFFSDSGLSLGINTMQVLVPSKESRSFEIPWQCADGVYYNALGSTSTTWIPNCAAGTARYGVSFAHQ